MIQAVGLRVSNAPIDTFENLQKANLVISSGVAIDLAKNQLRVVYGKYGVAKSVAIFINPSYISYFIKYSDNSIKNRVPIISRLIMSY